MHTKILFLFLLLALGIAPAAAPAAAPATALGLPAGVTPVANYTIQVSLDVDSKTLTGSQVVEYTNTTAEPIPDLVFHLYLNAFRSADSLFLRESGMNHRGFSVDMSEPGWVEVDSLRLADGTELALGEYEDGTLARAGLPEPVQPGETIRLEMDFRSRLPKVFARTGFAGDFFMAGQWFPKLGVWQETGWNAYPFHANAEFFADFGVYDVSIRLPEAYRTAGVGLPVEDNPNGDGTHTVRYLAEGVIDHAWAASPHFREAARQVGGVELVYVYLPEHDWSVERALDAGEAALTYYGEWYGPYPYPRLTIVDVPDDGGGAGGMEYPTMIMAGTQSVLGLGTFGERMGWERSLEVVIWHEAGHQWWQSVVAFNEAEEPWLDEGFTDYSTTRLGEVLHPEGDSVLDMGGFRASNLDLRRMNYVAAPRVPMYGAAWEFYGLFEYANAVYAKPALGLLTLEGVLGEETMLAVMRTFYTRYRFAHPTTEDFRRTAEEVSGQDLDWFFEGLVYGDGVLNYRVTEVSGEQARLERQGEVRVPTEVLVIFSDGTTLLEAWDGAEASLELRYPDRPAIRSVEIDPERKIVVDLVWSDNGLRTSPAVWPWLGLAGRILYQIQNALLLMGGL